MSNSRDRRGMEGESSSSIDAENTCLICLKNITFTSSRSLGAKAKATVINASERRKDKKYKQMMNATNLKIHDSCYSSYIREKSIQEAANKNKMYATAMRESVKMTKSFDFNNLCLLCEKPYRADRKKQNVPHIETIVVIGEDLENKTTLNDEDQLLLFRLNYLKESFDKCKPFYHTECFKKFFRYKSKN